MLAGAWVVCSLLASEARIRAEEPCPRPAPGSAITSPSDLRSANGSIKVQFSFRTVVGAGGFNRYCYVDQGGAQSPTIRVSPGDEVVIALTNDIPPSPASGHARTNQACADMVMSPQATNLHFHGLSIPPICHQDDVLYALVQPSGGSFEYRFRIPAAQPPGLYWYHPHPHGYSEAQVLGGASGALIVEGIERSKPEVAGLPERVLVLRDQRQTEKWEGSGEMGEDPKDISINFVPVKLPRLVPAVLNVRPAQREFWRVLNASADSFFNLQIIYELSQYNWAPQPLELIAVDGVPIGRREGTPDRSAKLLIAPGGRAEFIVTTPPAGVAARLMTYYYDTGPQGTVHPERIVATIVSRADNPPAASSIPGMPRATTAPAFAGLDSIQPVRERKLYLSEDRPDLLDPRQAARYYITEEGKTPKIFDMDFHEPDIVVRQGTVEDWTVENRSREAHTFHIHQLHFQLLERDHQAVREPMLRDTIDLPFWDGRNPRYPSVKLRMDFRAPEIVGTFVYHCHILEHEDGGMMGSIRVVRGNPDR